MFSNRMLSIRANTFPKSNREMGIIMKYSESNTCRWSDRLEMRMRFKYRGNYFLTLNKHMSEILCPSLLLDGCHRFFFLLGCNLFHISLVTMSINIKSIWRNMDNSIRLSDPRTFLILLTSSYGLLTLAYGKSNVSRLSMVFSTCSVPLDFFLALILGRFLCI